MGVGIWELLVYGKSTLFIFIGDVPVVFAWIKVIAWDFEFSNAKSYTSPVGDLISGLGNNIESGECVDLLCPGKQDGFSS